MWKEGHSTLPGSMLSSQEIDLGLLATAMNKKSVPNA